jgi:hypothetical protein
MRITNQPLRRTLIEPHETDHSSNLFSSEWNGIHSIIVELVNDDSKTVASGCEVKS